MCVGQPFGAEAAGGDGVDGDPVGGDLPRERLEEADRGHPVGVGEVEAGDRLAGRGGADVDDPAPAALAHSRQDGAGQHPRREDQRAVGGLPLLELVVEGAAERRPARVGDQDLDRAERLLDLARQRREAVEVRGVGDERRRCFADLGRRFVEFLARAAGDRHPRALAAPGRGDRPAEAAAGAHHQRDASLQPEVHAASLRPVSRSETSQRRSIALLMPSRRRIGLRTGGPLLTKSGP